MTGGMNRRTALKGLTSAGLAATGVVADALSRASAAPSQQIIPVRVLESQTTMPLTIRTLASARGYFREFGVDPQLLSVSPGPGTNFVSAFLQQQADVCIVSAFTQLIVEVEKGADLKIIAGANLKGQQALFSKNPAIQSVKDLEGRTVGVGAVGAQLYQATAALLREKGVDLAKVHFVDSGGSADVFRAVTSGAVDAGRGEADVIGIQDRLGIHMLKDSDYAVEIPEYTWQASFTSVAGLNAKHDALVRTLAAYCKTYRYIQNPASQDDFAKAYVAALGSAARDDAMVRANSMWKYLQTRKPYAEDLVLSEKRVNYMQKLNIELGVQKRSIPYDRLIDTSVAREAIKLLS
jgi:ABC-type nitrate/sulfonate/bicarbonate transport system substrate-binding protein